jgi:nanoRNase/pAp phosphatase (c-di-AMP/oligoRNAs hydrolase)
VILNLCQTKTRKLSMNDADVKVRRQIVDKVKNSTNILVTVSRDPSVDALSAAIGLTAVLNKLDKHTTAIFSGAMPPAIKFLEPDKVFESTADSLRDFIIALDKEKADHLRYKIDGDVVKIFITPYRTTITSDDLEFSQGDYNIDLVFALGVTSQEHLDAALTAHGKVLDEVTIITLSTGESASQLGTIDWYDKDTSSLCEMTATLSDDLKVDKSLLDKQIATALLTGIVATTDRFSNAKTSSRSMTVSAQLMAAGADQQLIATKLDEVSSVVVESPVAAPVAESEPIDTFSPAPNETIIPEENADQSTLPPGNLVVPHDSEPVAADTTPIDTVAPSIEAETAMPGAVDTAVSTLPPEEQLNDVVGTIPSQEADEPSLGGTLNATTDQAAEDSRRELDDKQNRTILTHSYLRGSDANQAASINSIGADQTETSDNTNPFGSGFNTVSAGISNRPEQNVVIPPSQVNFAPEAMPNITPDSQMPKIDLPLPPPIPDFSTLPPIVPISPSTSPFNTSVQTEPVVNDPSQFRIPGQ